MRSALLFLLLSGFALAKEPARVPFPEGEEGRRAEDRNLRGDEKSKEYADALNRWQEKRGGDPDDAARRARLDRILKDETTRDEIPPVPREKPPEADQSAKREPEKQRLERPAEETGGSGAAASGVANLMTGILILLAAVVIALGIYSIVMAIQRSRRRPSAEGDVETVKTDDERGGAAPPIVRDPEEWLAEARRHAAAARWLEALRCLLFASLERLHRMRFIDYQRARTNRECVRAFTGPETRREPFGALVDAFDFAVYGQRPFGAAEYARAEAAARELGKGDANESVA